MAPETLTVDPPMARPARSPILPATIVGAICFALTASLAVGTVRSAPPADDVIFPSAVATYSWFTAHGDVGMPATMVYQNGIGVEFMDYPQAIALGLDGSTYRRLGPAEERAIPADQGDPADMVLSADGTFAVIAGANGQGNVVVQSLVDATSRDVAVGAGRSAVPVSIASDGDAMLILLGDGEMSGYTDLGMRLSGTLGLLTLSTGELREYSLEAVNSAAISPDGSLIAAQTAHGAVVMDAGEHAIRDLTPELREQAFGDDAWSPNSSRLVTLAHDDVWVDKPSGRTLTTTATLQISDLSGAEPVTAEFPLTGVAYAAVLGWRDDDTVVVQSHAEDNSAQFFWVDADTGASHAFATYDSGFTGASIGSADLARDLIDEWIVDTRPVDQRTAGQAWMHAILLGIAVGGVVALALWMSTRRRATRARRTWEEAARD